MEKTKGAEGNSGKEVGRARRSWWLDRNAVAVARPPTSLFPPSCAVREHVHPLFLDPVMPAPSGASFRAKAPAFGYLAALDSTSPRPQ